jgi:hypothetical protein
VHSTFLVSVRRIATLLRVLLLAALALGASLGLVLPAQADVAECERAYQLGRKDEAIKLCRRAAWQENDFFAQVKLGDIYSAKREDDKGYYDPVEAYVWYFIAAHNSAIFDHFHLDAAADFVVSKLASAENEAEGIYRNLLQDERIDARNRIMYIAACRGGDGFILLGQLQDPYINQRHSASTGPLSGVVADPWVHVPRPGGVYSRKIDSYSTTSTGSGYPAATSSYGGSYRTSFDFWVNKLCSNSDWFGWLMPNSCSRYSSALEGSTSAFQTSTIEAMVFYLLAERAGHPVAKQYIDELKRLTVGTGPDPKAAGNDLQAKAKAKAQTWRRSSSMPPKRGIVERPRPGWSTGMNAPSTCRVSAPWRRRIACSPWAGTCCVQSGSSGGPEPRIWCGRYPSTRTCWVIRRPVPLPRCSLPGLSRSWPSAETPRLSVFWASCM